MTAEKLSTDLYEEKLNTPEIKAWIKWESKFAKDIPLVRARYCFGRNSDMRKLIELILKRREEWDKNFITFQDLNSKQMLIIYSAMKPPLFFQKPKDFVEKVVEIRKNNIYYAYISSVPDDIYPITTKYERAQTIFSGMIIEVENGELIYTHFSQVDCKVFHFYFKF